MGLKQSKQKESKDINMDDNIYTLEQVSEHNSSDDAWIIVSGNVYDISAFNNHPGGNIISIGYGKDATDLFHSPRVKHSRHAKKLLKQYYIGKVEEVSQIRVVDTTNKID